ncbi:MAG: hypothetical protein E6K80_05895 [Candidatus Eisenbacteria bacterium]|uniref:Bacterial surface antigen (D15) domain-containing protein n=1 Tax=Eiseniibacteriota bacterium TaxID=2212470 RepID=A0A538U628_UNCEI|nr:MAG: hypothetical protein E6K80_05895 [Candidatus Eisenbacteria bacterium]
MIASTLLSALLCLGMASAGARAQGASPDTAAARPDTARVAPALPPAPESASPDTGLGGFLHGLADSTNAYFGPSSAPIDTVGLDSTLAFRLANPELMSDVRRERPSLSPWFTFNRVDGPLYGGAVTLGRAERRGSISGRLGYATGPDDWLGGGAYRKRWVARHEGRGAELRRRRRGETAWTLEVSGGRFTTILDPEYSVSWQRVLRALVNGSDRHHYYRRDGYRLRLERESARSRLVLGFRDQLESPLVTTDTWNLLHATPEVIPNLPAALGRAREVQLDATVRIPRTGWQAEADLHFALAALRSDFDYQRYAFATGGDVGLGRLATLVPQLQYGRLEGDVIPQAAFYLGGTHSLRSLVTDALAASRKAFGRADLIFTPDLAKLSHLPHPAALVLQGALFAGSGAVWGKDASSGARLTGDALPDRSEWISEAGASLLYRPGLPEPRGLLRLDYAHGVGNNPAHRVVLYYSVPLDLLRRLE